MTIHQLHLFLHKNILDSWPDHIICLLMVVEDKQIWKLGSWAELSPKVHHWHCPHCNPSLPCLSPCFCLKTNCKLSSPIEEKKNIFEQTLSAIQCIFSFTWNKKWCCDFESKHSLDGLVAGESYQWPHQRRSVARGILDVVTSAFSITVLHFSNRIERKKILKFHLSNS